MNGNDTSATAPRCIAVVAVHGVADQKPCETARTIADVLSRVTGEDGGRYLAFDEVDVRVPVREVMTDGIGARAEETPPLRSSLFALSQSQVVRSALERSRVARDEGADRPDVDEEPSATVAHEYMKGQLARYIPDVKDRAFETIRLESVRGSRPRRVHVYEAYWADLSRLESGILSAVLELYQLMFYVCSLGRKTIELTRNGNRSAWWGAFAWTHALVEWPLVLGVPILNLTVLALALVLFTIKIPSDPMSMALSGIGSLVVGAAIVTGFVVYLGRMWVRGAVWPALSLLVVLASVLAGAAGWLVFGRGASYRALGLMVFVLLAFLVLWLMAEYQRRRLGAFPLAIVVVLATLLDFVSQLSISGGPGRSESDALVNAALRSAEGVLFVLRACWGLIMVGIVAAAVTGVGAVYFGTPPARRRAASRAAWTANLSATLPAVIVIVLNLAAWSGIQATGTRIICELKPSAPAPGPAVPGEQRAICARPPIVYAPRFPEGQAETTPAGDAIVALLGQSAQPLLLVGLLAGAAALWAAWSLTPAVAGEFQRSQRYDARAAVWLGNALSAGFRAMRVSQLLLQLLFVLLVIGGALVYFGVLGRSLPVLPGTVAVLGGLVTLGITATKGPLKFLALGFRGALDVALDVTNWLRMHPLERNPRARICARYASLLRHICRWVDPVDGSRYDAVVIIAHSLGAVITAELLRFLKRQPCDPELERVFGRAPVLPIHLFTMGCPLRQLFATRFPDLYGWAWHNTQTWPGPRPAPAALGVESWANAFRSGDYVGRYLWFPDTGDDRWLTSQGPQNGRTEVCIGAGAHTHYWDQLPPDRIGAALDRLIANA